MLTTALLAALAAGAACAAWQIRRRAVVLEARLARAARDLEALQQAFSRFAPADVVEDIVAQGASTTPATKEVTILFADVKDFTPLAERLDPATLVQILNGYFEAMGQALAAHRGHLAKFIGDGLLAFFGGLEPNPWQTNDALHAALAMRAALIDYNARLDALGLPRLAIGIGIHRGPVVAGVLGTAELMEYGVIGRTVNLAARIEDLTRVHDVDILVSDAVRAACDARFRLRPMPPVGVKGVPGPFATYALDGAGDDGRRPAPAPAPVRRPADVRDRNRSG